MSFFTRDATRFLEEGHTLTQDPRIFKVLVLKETERAFLCRFKSGEEHWLPKSRCEVTDHKAHIPPWLVVEKQIKDSPIFCESDWMER